MRVVFKTLARATKVFNKETRQSTLTFFPESELELDLNEEQLADLTQFGAFTARCTSGPNKGTILDLTHPPRRIE